MKKSLKILRAEYKKLKRNKINTKKLMIELMETSSIDFTVDYMNMKLYKVGWLQRYNETFKFMDELSRDIKLIFCGREPVKVHGNIIREDPVFSLPAGVK